MSIITVSREFGSGGRELAKRLSDTLGMAYYDHEIITAIAKEAKLDEKYVERTLESMAFNNYPITFSRTFSGISAVNTITPQLFAVQHKIIRELAEKGDCIIVGRGANAVLREYHPFSIFVYADMASKITRCKQRAAEDEKLSDKEINKKIKQIDKDRAKNYYLVSNARWGDKSGYDLCLNTTNINIKEFTLIIAEYAKRWLEENKK